MHRLALEAFKFHQLNFPVTEANLAIATSLTLVLLGSIRVLKLVTTETMKARSLLASAVAACTLSSGPAAASAADSSTADAVPVAGNAEATRRVLSQTKEERVSLSAVAYMPPCEFVHL